MGHDLGCELGLGCILVLEGINEIVDEGDDIGDDGENASWEDINILVFEVTVPVFTNDGQLARVKLVCGILNQAGSGGRWQRRCKLKREQ